MKLRLEYQRGKHELSPYKFHVLPTITYMWHKLGGDTLYIGWLAFTLVIEW